VGNMLTPGATTKDVLSFHKGESFVNHMEVECVAR
jgi:hypothetical protein